MEIGAYLAYVGHYARSKDAVVKKIKREELTHMVEIKKILDQNGKAPSKILNGIFFVIGKLICGTCSITPLVLLDGIAQIMEVFNIISYDILAKSFGEHAETFHMMSKQEAEHEIYFSTFPKYGRIKT